MTNVDLVKLKAIVDATKAGTPVYIGQVQGQPMLANQPVLIEINTAVTNPSDPSEVLCRATADAEAFLAANQTSTEAGKSDAPKYQVITNAVLPPAKKRGNTSGSGAPTKYPFADMQVGATFFSPNSDHKNKDAVKSLGSTVSAQNEKYSEPTGEKRTVTRAVRDKTTKKAAIDPSTGKKITETVQLDVKKYNRKFTIRPVKAGETYGEWTAPADGALVGRTV